MIKYNVQFAPLNWFSFKPPLTHTYNYQLRNCTVQLHTSEQEAILQIKLPELNREISVDLYQLIANVLDDKEEQEKFTRNFPRVR